MLNQDSKPMVSQSPDQDQFESYFAYLQTRSKIGHIYRKCWLYPFLRLQLSGNVLDVGCGIGDFLASCSRCVGTDINPLVVNWCQSRGLNVRLMKANNLPFEDNSFDNVVLDNVLEHLVDPRELLAEICRVLAPNGCLLVGVPGKLGYACDSDHKVFYDEHKLEQVMLNAGLRKKKYFYMPLKSNWLAVHLPQFCLYGVFKRA